MPGDDIEAGTPPDVRAVPRPLSPATALELRVRFLETLLAPPSPAHTPAHRSPYAAAPLTRHVASLHEQLRTAIDHAQPAGAAEAVKRFVANYDANAPLLSVHEGPLRTEGQDLSPTERATVVLEAEQEIRTLERQLREIQLLHEQQHVMDQGHLRDAERLAGSLKEVHSAAGPVAEKYTHLEARTTALLQRYNHHISTLSEVFVGWDDLLTDVEATLTRLETARNPPLDIS
ncbi:hypothetical protein JCM8202_003655 [Rhodotorula sphaerocarpa]